MKLGDYLSIKQAADLSGYSERHIRYLIYNDKLERVKVGNMWFISEPSLLEYLAFADERGKSDGRYKPQDTTDT